MDSIKFNGYEYDPETKIRKGKTEQEELFDPVDELQKMATGEALRTHSHEEPQHVLDRDVPWGDPL